MTTSIAFASKCKIKRVQIIYTLIKTQRSYPFRLYIWGNNVRKLMGVNEINKTSFRCKFLYRKKQIFNFQNYTGFFVTFQFNFILRHHLSLVSQSHLPTLSSRLVKKKEKKEKKNKTNITQNKRIPYYLRLDKMILHYSVKLDWKSELNTCKRKIQPLYQFFQIFY